MNNDIFHLRISKTAQRLDFAAIPANIRNCLCSCISFNPEEHDIYQFSVYPDPQKPSIASKQKKSRRIKKRGYESTDQIRVVMEPGSESMKICGIYPWNLNGQNFSQPSENEVIIEIGSSPIRLAYKKKFYNKTKKGDILIQSFQDLDLAQWVFFKKYLQANLSLGMKFLCVVPKWAPEPERNVICIAEAKHKGNSIFPATKKKIYLPLK